MPSAYFQLAVCHFQLDRASQLIIFVFQTPNPSGLILYVILRNFWEEFSAYAQGEPTMQKVDTTLAFLYQNRFSRSYITCEHRANSGHKDHIWRRSSMISDYQNTVLWNATPFCHLPLQMKSLLAQQARS